MIYHAVHAGRALLGRTDQEIVVRDNITYDLNLSEGIDFGIYLANFYERQTRSALSRLVSPGSLVLDIGANIGAHTLHLAQLVGPLGRVLAFEPTEFAFRKLRRNLDLNPSSPPGWNCFIVSSPRRTASACRMTSIPAGPSSWRVGCTPSISAAR